MRDLMMLLLLAGGSIWALRTPWIGAMLWTVISLGSSHIEFAHSAGSWPVASVVAVSTLIGLLRTTVRHNPIIGAPSAWLLAFVVWITITLSSSFYFDDSFSLWERSMKIFLMVFVMMVLIDSKKTSTSSSGRWCARWAITAQRWRLHHRDGGRIPRLGAGGFIEGNSEYALAMIMTLPLARYLRLQSRLRGVRWALTAAMLVMVVMVLGAHSRGAPLGLAAMGLVLWLESPCKLLLGRAIIGSCSSPCRSCPTTGGRASGPSGRTSRTARRSAASTHGGTRGTWPERMCFAAAS